MTDQRDSTNDREDEFDRFARSAADDLKRTPPPGGAASIVRAGDRRRTRQRLILAVGGAAVMAVAIVAFMAARDDSPENGAIGDPAPPTAVALVDSSAASTAVNASTTLAPSTTAATTTTAPPLVVLESELPSAVPLSSASDLTVTTSLGLSYLSAGSGSLWSASTQSGQGIRLSAVDGSAQATIDGVYARAGFAVGRPAIGFGSTWYLKYDRVVRVDHATNTITAEIPIGGSGQELVPAGWLSDIVADDRGVWTISHAAGDEAAIRIDPQTNEVAERFPMESPRTLTFAAGSLWVTHGTDGQFVTRHDPASGAELARIDLPFVPGTLMGNDAALWVGGQAAGAPGEWHAAHIDPATNALVADVTIGSGLGDLTFSYADLAVTDRSAWFSTNQGVVRIDTADNAVTGSYRWDVGSGGGGVTFDGTSVWVSQPDQASLHRIPESAV